MRTRRRGSQPVPPSGERWRGTRVGLDSRGGERTLVAMRLKVRCEVRGRGGAPRTSKPRAARG
eukprot:6526857-Prymnesium_polylepis.1